MPRRAGRDGAFSILEFVVLSGLDHGIAVKGRIVKIDIFLIHLFFAQPQTLTEALEMDNLPLSEESDDIVDIGIIGQAQNVVIGLAGLLFGGKILGQIGDHITGGLDRGGTPWETGSGSGVDACGMIHKVGGKAGVFLNLFVGQIAGQLMDNGGHHFQMAQFFSAESGGETEEYVRNPCAARDCGVEQRRNGECAKTGVAV